MSQCQRCEQETRDDAYVCDPCIDKFARVLGDMTWLADELETTITKQRSATTGNGAASATCSCKDDDDKCQHALIPYHLPAVEKRDALRHQLVTLVRFCNEEGIRNSDHRGVLPDNTLQSMGRWLLWRCDGLAFNDMAAEFISAVTDAARACRRVVDRPPERQYAGPCPGCKRDLYARMDAAEVTCRPCGDTYDVAQLYAWMREQVYGRLVTAREGATLLSRFGMETQQATIDKWHDRNRVVSRGHDAKKRRLYLFDDLVSLAAAAQSATSGRTPA